MLSAALFLMLLSAPQLRAEESANLEAKLKTIDSDIGKLEQMIKGGEKDPIFSQHLKKLQAEKADYEKLLRRVTKKKSKPQTYTDETAKKTIPAAVRSDLEAYQTYRDQAIPMEKRYDLILSELNNLYQLNGQLGTLTPTDQLKATIAENNKKIGELEQLKLEYEIKVRESEDLDTSEMRKSGVRVGVIADLYYQWSFNRPQRNSDTSGEIPYKNYTNRHNDFTINLLELNFAKSFKGTDFYADIDFGEQPLQNNYLTSDADHVTRHVGQAFLRHQFTDFGGVTLTAGKFYTHFGLETPKNTENRNYSRPVYYNLVCPFWHEGIALTKSGLGNFGVGFYVYDKTDKRADNNSGKVYGSQISYNTPSFGLVANTISGSEQDSAGNTKEGDLKTQHEIIATYHVTEKLSLVVDGVIGENAAYDATTGKDARWSSLVGYTEYKLLPRDTVVLRVENFRDLTSSSASANLFTTTANPNVKPADVMSYTFTNRYTIGNGAEFRTEVRYDSANEELYPNRRGSFNRDQATLMAGWLYSI